MNTDSLTPLAPPRFENSEALLLAGLSERYRAETVVGIPALWQRFGRHSGKLPGQVGHLAYGVCFNSDGAGSFDYLCGVEVADFAALPSSWTRLRIAPQRYAVFIHRGHISGIRGTWNAIWNQWLPQSGLEAADAPDFERYDERFDPRTGLGDVKVWIPVNA
jgi:AraC family transcriptional regulator